MIMTTITTIKMRQKSEWLTFMLYLKMLNHLIHCRNSGTVQTLTSSPLNTIMQTQTRAVRMVPMECCLVDALNTSATEQPAKLVITMLSK